MRRGSRGNNQNDALQTINAAASAIASSENRVPQAMVRQKRRWGGCWSLYRCFGYQRQTKRIGHADVSFETSAPRNIAPAAENPTQASAILLPFVAPPSSPASYLQSETPSVTQSPVCLLSISASMYSPCGPTSIFAIGPYAHETQLVSPPIFSTYTTEPSTAPFTPPPESVHLTTPSSPEVPFAQLLDPSLQNGEGGPRFPLYNHEFPSYLLYPGSPVGQLISPSSAISGSGTSSPFCDGEFTTGGPHFLDFPMPHPPKLLNLDKLSSLKWGSHHGSVSLTPDSVRQTSGSFCVDGQFSNVAFHQHSDNTCQKDQTVGHTVFFDLTAEDASMKEASSVKAMPESPGNGKLAREGENSAELAQNTGIQVGETSNDPPEKAIADVLEPPHHRKDPSITLGSLKEFNFDNTDGDDCHNASIGPGWWANGVVVGDDHGATKNWSFFPMMQTGVS